MATTLSTAFNTLLCLVGIVVIQQLYTRLFRRDTTPYPPGPPGKPIVGHLGLPENPAWIKFDQWAKQYSASFAFAGETQANGRVLCRTGSDVIRLNVVGKSLIVLNSMKAATDLLDKRSAMYSDRFRLVMTTELYVRTLHQRFQTLTLTAGAVGVGTSSFSDTTTNGGTVVNYSTPNLGPKISPNIGRSSRGTWLRCCGLWLTSRRISPKR